MRECTLQQCLGRVLHVKWHPMKARTQVLPAEHCYQMINPLNPFIHMNVLANQCLCLWSPSTAEYYSTQTHIAQHALTRKERIWSNKEIAETENQSNFALMRPMSAFLSHAVLHTSVILTKRAHIVLTPMWDPFQEDDSGRTWREHGAGAGRWNCWRDILTFKSLFLYLSRLRGHIVHPYCKLQNLF